MKLPFELAIREATLPPELREEIAGHAGRLEHFYDRITRCRVTVTGPGRHAHGRWTLKIALTVPGREILITRQGGDDLAEAVREAFSAAARRLEDYVRRRRGFVKTPAQREA
jgi:ribosome-associated translation inhibitor RaiA